jgi:Domain of unknown function (DUF222)/HNH endonuclease
MDSNTHSTGRSTSEPAELAALETAVDRLATHDLDRLADAALIERAQTLRGLGDRLEGQWLRTLAAVDARGAAGAEDGVPAGSTAGWLRRRLRMSVGTATSLVRTARALYRGPLAATAQAMADGEVSPAHAQVLAAGTHHLPTQVAAEAEPVLLEAARRLDPPRLRQAMAHLRLVADPDGASDRRAERQHGQRGLWLSATWAGMVAVNGLLDPEAGQTLAAALEPLARPANAQDPRSGGQRRADALAELARRHLEGGRLPQSGGVRPQLLVTVDLASLLGPGGVGGEAGGPVPLDPEACRRLACDGAVTRVLVTRTDPTHDDSGGDGSLAARLQAATRLPPTLGGAPTQPLEVGRTSRVVSAAQRAALTVRDRGCAFPDCDRPPAWCEAHHLVHWLHGGPTDLDNLALLCRAHHRAVHEGGWRLGRDPDGRLTATPPHRQHRRPRAAA